MNALELLRTYEEKLLDATFRKSSLEVAQILSEDFEEFGRSGRVFSKDATIALLQQEAVSHIEIEGFAAEMLSDTVALVTYRTTRSGAEEPKIQSLRSSVWVYKDGRWRLRFHQGTQAAASGDASCTP